MSLRLLYLIFVRLCGWLVMLGDLGPLPVGNGCAPCASGGKHTARVGTGLAQ